MEPKSTGGAKKHQWSQSRKFYLFRYYCSVNSFSVLERKTQLLNEEVGLHVRGYFCRQLNLRTQNELNTYSNVLTVIGDEFISVGRNFKCIVAHLDPPGTQKNLCQEIFDNDEPSPVVDQPSSVVDRHGIMQFSPDSLNFLISKAPAVIGPVVAGATAACVRKRKEEEDRGCRRCQEDHVFHHHEHVPVGNVHRTMGARIVCHAFCMTLISFLHLHSILLPLIRAASIAIRDYQGKGGRVGVNYVLPPIRNGSISPSIRLGVALRYFAGGSPYDIVCLWH